jgi:uroporphyrinogen decarboxylase
MKREPDFANLQAVCRRSRPDRPTLFEFLIDESVCERLNGAKRKGDDEVSRVRFLAEAFRNGGYDYVPIKPESFDFVRKGVAKDKTISLNEGVLISGWKDYESYPWPDPLSADYSILEKAEGFLPGGMRLIVWAPWGVMENANSLLGYQNLGLLTYDDPQLLKVTFDAIGSRLLSFYRECLDHPLVGGIIYNDDWGFSTQTMLSPDFFRSYVFGWVREIVAAAHAAGKLAILHSCGQLQSIMDEIIDDLKFDAKHSFQDKVQPVEEAYDRYGSRIALLGGLDIDFMCRSRSEQVRERAIHMLEISSERGGYALGTGNSVPYYMPVENYLAMIDVVRQFPS